ncbi:MAG: hypothetical protein WHS88_09625 [Anaerohalosphaeraceae bacterium]
MKLSKQNLFPLAAFALLGLLLGRAAYPHTMKPGEYLIWGISSQQAAIPVGSVITEAVLTIHDIVPVKNPRFYIHLLDNPLEWVQKGNTAESGNAFQGYGVPLKGTVVNGKWVCRLSQVNDRASSIWTVYKNPCIIKLSNGSKVSLSSSLLELIDYIGNGGGFGFGIDFESICSFTQITLDITAQTFLGTYERQTFSFTMSNLYSYDEALKRWIYLDGTEPDDWERDNPSAGTLTISRCQVTAGSVIGQDTMTASGKFTGAPNLFWVPRIELSVVSLLDDKTVYTESCGFTWDKVRNQFTWSRRLTNNQPGGITSLRFDFSAQTFSLTLSRVDLTGLSSPIRLNLTIGSVSYTGEVDESIINGSGRIPIRLMRNYRDELRISKAAAVKGRTAGTDQLSITGEIAVADVAGTDLRVLPVTVIWGRQVFTIPQGSFQIGRGNVYTCSNIPVPEGGLITCRIDLDKCLFSVILRSASIELVPGRPADANLQIRRAAD